MLLDIVAKGTTDYSCIVRVVDSSDGTPETSVAFDTAGIDLWYRRPGAVHTSITEATQTENGAHSDGGFVHISDGYCRLDLPDAAVAAGADYVDVGGTITGMVVIGGRIRLTGVDLDDAVRGGMTALPNAAADAAGGLIISDAGGLDADAQAASVAAVETDTDTTIPGLIAALNNLSASQVNDQVADVMKTDTIGDPAQGAPPLNATMQAMINYIYRWAIRNRKTVDSSSSPTVETVYADDGTTELFKRDISDAASVTTFAESETGV